MNLFQGVSENASTASNEERQRQDVTCRGEVDEEERLDDDEAPALMQQQPDGRTLTRTEPSRRKVRASLGNMHTSVLKLFEGKSDDGVSSIRVLLFLSPLLPVVVCLFLLFVPCYLIPALLVKDLVLRQPMTADIEFLLFVSGLSAVPIMAFLVFAMKNATSLCIGSDDNDENTANKGPVGFLEKLHSLQSPILACLCVILFHLREMSTAVIHEQFQETTTNLLQRALAMTLYSTLGSMLSESHLISVNFADKVDQVAKYAEKSQKGLGMMKNFSRFNDYDIDSAYVLPRGSRSPARVLSEIVAVYCNIGKVMGGTLLFLYLIGIDIMTNFVVIGLTVVFGAIISALQINRALANVLPLALSNAFHVGDIVSLARTGMTPADRPVTHLCGFVEGVTWGHIVIRDFRRKQVFLPHGSFDQATISNWSRRPSKLCFFQIKVVPGLSGGAAPLARLAQYARDWINKHPSIDQTTYKKSCIKFTPISGQFLEAIFYPLPGQKARIIRSEFIVMITEAARRLDICITPAEVRTGYAWEQGEKERDIDILDLSDLMPSDELTLKSGFIPKPKQS